MIPLLLLAAAAAAIALGSESGGGGGAPAGGGTAPGLPPLPPGALGRPNPLPSPDGGPPNFWDANLTPAEVIAVTQALHTETDPAKLAAFGASLAAAGHPLAAAACAARAAQLAAAQILPPAPHPNAPPPPPSPPSPPSPAPSFTTQPNATVTTHDTGPSGNLNVRQTPTSDGTLLGQFAHGERVQITGPAIGGFFPATNGHVSGFASAQFLTQDGAAVIPALFGGQTGPSVLMGTITTHDTGPSGNLNVRDVPGGKVIGQFAHNQRVAITGPQSAGFFPVSGAGVNGAALAGFASTQFVTVDGAPSVTAGYSAGFVGAAPSPLVRVTSAQPIGLRASPDARAPFIAQAPPGSTFRALGNPQHGFVPLADDAGRVLWAQALQLSRVAPNVGSGGDVIAGPSSSYAELHDAALALKTALAIHGCRSHNEPIVKRFQRAATASGIYDGLPDGWYGTKTQAALSQIVGKPAPACFDEPTGGPVNPQEYWSPMGA